MNQFLYENYRLKILLVKTHEIFKKFDLYDTIVQNNYMFHQQMIDATKNRLKSEDLKFPFRHLDLGCGNAYFISNIYQTASEVNYVGVDLSQTALNNAKIELQKMKKWTLQLRCQNLLDHMNQQGDEVRFITAGYCLHHLSTENKKQVFGRIKQRLKSGGSFFFYDVMRNNDEDRNSYNKRGVAIYRRDWGKIPEASLKRIEEHVLNEDFPEKRETYEKWGKEFGFSSSNILFQDPNALFTLMEFKN